MYLRNLSGSFVPKRLKCVAGPVLAVSILTELVTADLKLSSRAAKKLLKSRCHIIGMDALLVDVILPSAGMRREGLHCSNTILDIELDGIFGESFTSFMKAG
jgi:hypothetical protein